MDGYIFTFHSHHFALKFKKNNSNLNVTLMSVPRKLSSSCGTCALVKENNIKNIIYNENEIEIIAKKNDDEYEIIKTFL